MYRNIAFYVPGPYSLTMEKVQFEWDERKDRENQRKHGVSFAQARDASADPGRVIAKDLAHSQAERRYYCMGRVGDGIMTVRFTYRRHKIRIIGAGYWRKGRDVYHAERP